MSGGDAEAALAHARGEASSLRQQLDEMRNKLFAEQRKVFDEKADRLRTEQREREANRLRDGALESLQRAEREASAARSLLRDADGTTKLVQRLTRRCINVRRATRTLVRKSHPDKVRPCLACAEAFSGVTQGLTDLLELADQAKVLVGDDAWRLAETCQSHK